MKRRIAMVAVIAAILISGALVAQSGDTAQAASGPTPPVHTNGSSWS